MLEVINHGTHSSSSRYTLTTQNVYLLRCLSPALFRQDGRERNPGPTLEGIGERGSASSVLLSLKTHK